MSQRWDNSSRSSRLPGNWSTLRLQALRRDGYMCQLCGSEATQVDHIIPGDDHSPGNLQSLCGSCHAIKTRQEGQEALRQKRAYLKRITHRKPEPNPGSIPPSQAKPRRKGW